MSVGKASIKRASAAGRKKTVINTVENPAVESAVVEKAAALIPVYTEEIQTKFISKEVKDENPNRPVRLKDEMPTYLL